MSAYAAVRDKSSSGSIFESNDSENDNEEEIRYQRNSSDDEKSDTGNVFSSLFHKRSLNLEDANERTTREYGNVISESKFQPDDDNIVVSADYIIIGLKINEYILIHGQCHLIVERGAILVNKLHYLPADFENSYEIIASSSQAVPTISSTQVVDRKVIKDHKTSENAHLFSNDYKSVIRLKNLRTGIENIGRYYRPFKNFIHPIEEDSFELDDFEKLFKTYSFEIVLRPKGITGFDLTKSWKDDIGKVISGIDVYQSNKLMVIGNKNSGKSTLCKTIMNLLILDNNTNISLLDLDPGQSDFSIPSCLSLSSITKPIFGANLPPRKAGLDDERINLFYGFNSPQEDPDSYIRIVSLLVEHYRKYHEPKGATLIVNTPGWIKGYGKEILIQVTSIVQPEKLILLSGNTNEEDNSDLLSGLTFSSLDIIYGIYQSSKYSPFQLRTLAKLLYFHHKTESLFDFEQHTLLRSPYKVSYDFSNIRPKDFKGISSVSVLHHNAGTDFDLNDIALMIESSVVAVYTIEEDIYASVAHKVLNHSSLPNYLNSSDFETLSRDNTPSQVVFLGLAMVHSVNIEDKYFNIYLSPDMLSEIRASTDSGYKLILAKGDGEIESAEILMDELLMEYSKQLKQSRKNKATDAHSPLPMSYPYTSFDANNRLNGTWRVRKNVMRRSHRH